MSARSTQRLVLAGAAALLVALTPSCGILNIFRGKQRDPVEETIKLQTEVMRLADQVILDVNRSARRFSRETNTPDAHYQSVVWSVSATNRVLSITTSPRPITALIDLCLYVSVARIVHEKHVVPEVYGEADRPMLDAYTRLETRCWSQLADVLDEKTVASVRQMLADWQAQNPDLTNAALLEGPSFSDIAPERGDRSNAMDDLSQLLTFDPLVGLEPAVQEVATTRQLGERVLFFVQHMPRLLTQEVELMSMRTAKMPEVKEALANVERFSLAAQQFSTAVEALPDTLRTERESAVDQISSELSAQREGIVSDLERARAPLQALLGDGRDVLESGTRMSESVAGAIGTLDAFISRHSHSPSDAPSEAAPAGKPFDVADYAAAASRIADASEKITAAIATADQSLPRVQRVLDEAEVRANATIDRAYRRALTLLLCAAGLFAAAAILVRAIGARRAPPPGSHSSSGSHPSAT